MHHYFRPKTKKTTDYDGNHYTHTVTQSRHDGVPHLAHFVETTSWRRVLPDSHSFFAPPPPPELFLHPRKKTPFTCLPFPMELPLSWLMWPLWAFRDSTVSWHIHSWSHLGSWNVQFVPKILLPFVTPRQQIPFPEVQDDTGVSQQVKIPTLHQGPTKWQLVHHKKCDVEDPSNSTVHSPYPALCFDVHVRAPTCQSRGVCNLLRVELPWYHLRPSVPLFLSPSS